MIDWENIFDEIQICKGASTAEIAAFVNDFSLPLTKNEITETEQNLLKINLDINLYSPAKWTFPQKPFPESFIQFLTWNNGGWCRRGEREFGFLGTNDLRNYTLAYMFPEWMPEAVPFALNGGGVFYVFDMREDFKNGEYPILISEAGNLGFDDAKIIAHSFTQACRETTNIEEFL